MRITTGKQNGAARVVLYGPEGIGKTTFASMFPRPLFMDIEGGTRKMSVDRFEVANYADTISAVYELQRDTQGYQTLVIDTADWMERLIAAKVCVSKAKDTLIDIGYGNGAKLVTEEWGKFLDIIGGMQRANGMNVVFCAHSWSKKIKLPGEVEAYDHYELKMNSTSGPILKEWADFVLFLRYNVLVSTDKDGHTTAQGGQRVICTSHTVLYDAKTRVALPEILPMDTNGIGQILAAIFPPQTEAAPAPAPAPEPVPAPAPVSAPVPVPTPAPVSAPAPAPVMPPVPADDLSSISAKGPNHAKLAGIMQERGWTREDLGRVAKMKKAYMNGEPIEVWNENFCEMCVIHAENIGKWLNK